jgi:hypothetical protein
MTDRDLVRYITREVYKILSQQDNMPDHAGGKNQRVVILLTGGTLGFDAALEAVKRYKNDLCYVLVCSTGAGKVHNVNRIAADIGAVDILLEGEEGLADPLFFLEEVSGVVVPALSRNTAAKIAHTDYDRLGPAVILEALMLGLPVIAARDSADPDHGDWAALGVTATTEGLKKALRTNLETMKGLGVLVTPASEVEKAFREMLLPCIEATDNKPGDAPVAGGGMLISAEDIKKAKDQEEDTLILPRRTIITPLARDLAEKLGISLEFR